MITRQIPYFFHLLFELCPMVYFISAFQDLQNSVPWGPSPLCIMFCSVKVTHLYAKDDTFNPANIDIFFLQKIC